MPQGPFPDTPGFVTGLLEERGHGDGALGEDMHVVARDGRVGGVLAGKKNQAGWTANGMPGIMVGEAQPFFGHAVEAWGLDYFLPIATQVSVAQIVAHDVDQVGFRIGLGQAELSPKEEHGQNEQGELIH